MKQNILVLFFQDFFVGSAGLFVNFVTLIFFSSIKITVEYLLHIQQLLFLLLSLTFFHLCLLSLPQVGGQSDKE